LVSAVILGLFFATIAYAAIIEWNRRYGRLTEKKARAAGSVVAGVSPLLVTHCSIRKDIEDGDRRSDRNQAKTVVP
jgi:hypothetical protein